MGKGMYRIADEWAQIEKYSAMKKICRILKFRAFCYIHRRCFPL